jgi:osmotically-inducible protein OsmY
MKTDEILQLDVNKALKSESLVTSCSVRVVSLNGVVTLSGIVDQYVKKAVVENITKNVTGVKSVINSIDIMLHSWDEKKDVEITAEILNVFRWNWNTVNDIIKVKVINGWVTLSGEMAWNYQKEAAKDAVTNLIGVKGVINTITIKSHNETKINECTLKLALQNHLALDPNDIEVEVVDANITLKGTVETWFQKELAGRIAWKASGVINVRNELLIEEE